MPFMYLKSFDEINSNVKIIMSTDDNSDYYFYMPIVSKIWIELGFKPVIVVIGGEEYNPTKQLAVRKTLEAGGDIVFILNTYLGDFLGYQHSMLAQFIVTGKQ